MTIEPDQPVATLLEIHQGPDIALQFLVDTLNQLGDTMSVGITLLVHGHVVTGEAVGGRAFFESVAQRAKPEEGDNEATAVVREGLKKTFETLRDSYPSFPAGDESDDEDEEAAPLKTTAYIHMKNAYVIRGIEGAATIPTGDGLWLRLRLSAVDGFTMGTMTVS